MKLVKNSLKIDESSFLFSRSNAYYGTTTYLFNFYPWYHIEVAIHFERHLLI